MDENRLIAKEDEMDESELSVKRFFEHGRFEITRVSRPKAIAHNKNDSSPKSLSDYFPKHCDFSVTYNSEKYLVEVKTREENEDTEKELKQGMLQKN